MKKVSYVIGILISLSQNIHAQYGSAYIDDLFIATRNIESVTTPPASVSNSDFNNRNVYLDLSFNLNNHETLDSIEIKYGKQTATGDILTLKFKYSISNGVSSLIDGNKIYSFTGNKIYISELIPESTLKQHAYIWIRCKNSSGISNTLISKQYN